VLTTRILGVDPGSRIIGWGLVEQCGSRLVHVAHGIVSPEGDELCDRLVGIERALEEVITAHRPDAAAVESLFYAKNAQSAAKLGHARGVVLLVLRRAGLTISEYAPAQIKRAVTGRGAAEKRQVAELVGRVLALNAPPTADAADALAVALTHLQAQRYHEALASKGRPGHR
jgi:crossover junction endodeoxyribonuclease RuvC